MPRARTPSTRKKIRLIPKRRFRSQSPLNRSTRKRMSKQKSRKPLQTASLTTLGRPGKAPTKKGKRMQLDEELKSILLEKLESQNLMSDFDLTHRYTMGIKGHEFTNLRAINLVKLTKYVENDEALNDRQFWEDYDQSSLKLSIPPKRKRQLKVSDLKNPTARENKNLYAYVLGCIQEKMAEGFFDKTDTITPEEERE